MREALDLLMKVDPQKAEITTENLSKFMDQYRSVNKAESVLRYSNLTTYDGIKEAIVQIMNILKVNPVTTEFSDVLLTDLFIDLSQSLEDFENTELTDIMPDYTGTTLSSMSLIETVGYNIRKVLETYIDVLEKRYTQLRYAERLVVKDFYYLKCDMIETFDKLGRQVYG
jgi:hypothetical protein